MPKVKRQLTAYGRWVKIQLMDKNMTASELAEQAQIPKQRISDLMYGVLPGMRYRPKIEEALGEKPPADLERVS